MSGITRITLFSEMVYPMLKQHNLHHLPYEVVTTLQSGSGKQPDYKITLKFNKKLNLIAQESSPFEAIEALEQSLIMKKHNLNVNSITVVDPETVN